MRETIPLYRNPEPALRVPLARRGEASSDSDDAQT